MAVHDMLMAAAGGTAGAVNYIDDVFSTYLYTGNGSTQTITNGMDLATDGGLVWIKTRSDLGSNSLWDTVRGTGKALLSNETGAQQTVSSTQGLTAFNSNGFSVGTDAWSENGSGITIASWTFAKQAKFFDVVTYTGTGSARTVAHNLGSTPGCIIVKATSSASNWVVYHRSLSTNNSNLYLNTTSAEVTTENFWNNTAPTSSVFSLGGSGAGAVNADGVTYVAYLFAHDAGGFGTAGTDNVISCGSYTGNGTTSGPEINLGYEPQWVMIKRTNVANSWVMLDVMRQFSVTDDAILTANTSNAEYSTSAPDVVPTATGFQPRQATANVNANGGTYIYIAIRRPMKPPTTGTEVFSPIVYTGNATANTLRTAGFPVDMVWGLNRDGNSNKVSYDRLRGAARRLAISSTAAEASESSSLEGVLGFDSNVGYKAGQDQGAGAINFSGWTYANAMFKRAPGFFDVVCYTGTGSNTTFTHNLTVAPELMIIRSRSDESFWYVGSSEIAASERLLLNAVNGKATDSTAFNSTRPTSSVFTVGTNAGVNGSGSTYVAYLFATVAGVSKVGSYTGNGSSQTINCGFSGGARFFLVKRTDSTGDWWVYDSARGIVTGNDPALTLNGAGVTEVTSADAVDPTNSGIIVNQESTCNINVNSATYIYLAIA